MQPSGDASAEAALLQGVACGDATSVRALVAALDVAYGATPWHLSTKQDLSSGTKGSTRNWRT